MANQKLLYSVAEAAAMIQTTVEGLRWMRRTNRGPKYIRKGRRLYYAHTDLAEYVEGLRRDHRGGAA